jgi:FAD:protein FMN transferase
VAIRAEAAMGTTVSVEAPGAEPAAIDRAFEWFRTVEYVCTRFDPDSELCRLTAHPGTAVTVGPLLFEAVRFAIHVAEISGGAFDPTLGATLQQRGFNREHRTGATVPVMVEPPEDVTYRDIAINTEQHTITLRRPLLLDLGAVAKGLAIDLATRELLPYGSFAIDAGGDLYLGGTNRAGQPWSIGIRHPRGPGQCIAAIQVSNKAVCTSGDYERTVTRPAEAGHHAGPPEGGPQDSPAEAGPYKPREHHIIDPRTRSSPTNVASVTVIAPSAMLADALATAAFVLGPERGLALLEQLDVDGLIVDDQLELRQTPGWSAFAQNAAVRPRRVEPVATKPAGEVG